MTQPLNLAAFKAYDVRGRIPDELNPELVYLVGHSDFDVAARAADACKKELARSAEWLGSRRTVCRICCKRSSGKEDSRQV